MIYVIVATQLITVLAGLVAVRWCLAYLADRDQTEQKSYEFYVNSLAEVRVAYHADLKNLIDQSFKEREFLLERVQHPQQTQAQAGGVTGETGITVIDEEEEARSEGLFDEDEETHEIPVKPVQPIRPFKEA